MLVIYLLIKNFLRFNTPAFFYDPFIFPKKTPNLSTSIFHNPINNTFMTQNLSTQISSPKENNSILPKNKEYSIKNHNFNSPSASLQSQNLNSSLNHRLSVKIFKFNRGVPNEEVDDINNKISKSLAQVLKLSKKANKFDFNCTV